jgi:hypothetical protein
MLFDRLLEKQCRLIRFAKNRRCTTHHGECAGSVRFADVSQINLCRPRLSPPTFRKRNSPRSHHDNNDDSGERLHRDQSLVPVVPKLKHALASIESAPSTE